MDSDRYADLPLVILTPGRKTSLICGSSSNCRLGGNSPGTMDCDLHQFLDLTFSVLLYCTTPASSPTKVG